MGMSADGIFAVPPPAVFAAVIPLVEFALGFDLKAVDNAAVPNITVRYMAAHEGVDASYLFGELVVYRHCILGHLTSHTPLEIVC